VTLRLRSVLANVALAAFAFLLFGLALEAALRVAGFVPERQLASRRVVDASWTTLLDCYPSNPRGYFDIDLRRPDADARYRHLAPHRFDSIASLHPWAVESVYDRRRFRDEEVGPKPKSVRRVVVFGDSFAEGQGVKEEDTVARVLGRLLDERAPGRFDVRNGGRRGLDFPELYAAFEDALAWEPDLLIYTLVLNDAVQPPEFRARQSFVNDWILDRESLPDTEAGPPSALRPRVFDFVYGRIAEWRIGRATTRWYLDMWSDGNREGWARTREYVREMKERLAKGGGRLLVAPWPLFVGLEGAYPFAPVHETIRRFCLAEGIAHHDLLPAFQGRRSADFWVHPVDHHPNETAHRLAAESLLPVVLELSGPLYLSGESARSPQSRASSAPSSASPRHSKRLRTCCPRRSLRADVASMASTRVRARVAAPSAARRARSAGGSSSKPRSAPSRASMAAASRAAPPSFPSPKAETASSERPMRWTIVRAWGRLIRTQRL
jgi:lysophospholipase L1-like esterase